MTIVHVKPFLEISHQFEVALIPRFDVFAHIVENDLRARRITVCRIQGGQLYAHRRIGSAGHPGQGCLGFCLASR